MIGLGVVFFPLFISLFVFLMSNSTESTLSKWLSRFSWVGLALNAVLIFGRVFSLFPNIIESGVLFSGHEYAIEPVFLFEEKSLALMGLSSFLFWVIMRFSRVYLHREAGFHRFFRTLLLCHFGLNLIASSGNFECFFIGWEVVGLTSFLLISFYRDRATPVWNAFRIYCVYRLCDVGILLAGYITHHEFGLGNQFLGFNPEKMNELIITHPWMVFILGASILVGALGKSAQFPFSFWLPRALEGPTPSSAIFYGALSIHAGIFLLLRTQALWMPVISVRILVFMFGMISLVIGTMVGRAQANIKGQIGYASIAQVGIMFMEVALGWNDLVLIHFCSHAILRSYQFLTSPSVVTHFIRQPVKDQQSSFFGFTNLPILRRLSIGEFFMEEFWVRFLIKPLKTVGSSWLLLAILGGMIFWITGISGNTPVQSQIMILSVIFSIKAISSSESKLAFLYLVLSVLIQVYTGTSFFKDLEGVFICSLGLVPGLIFWFMGTDSSRLLAWLCIAGFPITSFYLGEDLLIQFLGEFGLAPLVFFFIGYVLNGVVMARIFVLNTWLRTARALD